MKQYSGIGASEGVGIGKIFIKPEHNTDKVYTIESAERELEKFKTAHQEAQAGIAKLAVKAQENMGKEQAAIFEAHMQMIQDPELVGGVEGHIQSGTGAVAAVETVVGLYVQMFEAMPDPYLRERAIDISDIGRRIIAHLRQEQLFDPTTLDGAILVAADLTPSDTALLNNKLVSAIVTELGGATSHSAIIAKTLGIPAVMGIKQATSLFVNGMEAIVDGAAGLVLENPDLETKQRYEEKQAAIADYRKTLEIYLNQHTVTLDGKKIEVSANIAKPAEAQAAVDGGAEGIGLFRSEFIFMDRLEAPSEEEQYKAYKQVLETMGDRPVIIRTMDIGGDKQVPYLGLEKEENPFLGYRAVRYCLDHPEFFKTQLRALLRAGVHGRLRIMVPMIATVKEVRRVKALIEEAKAELSAAHVAFTSDYELGIMIEIPSAALQSHALAKEVDFFSIGTNDLTQYTLAVDRMNASLADLYNPMDPSVLRLVDMTIKNGHAAGIWVGMCGNASGNPKMIPILLGMGLDEFSVSPVSVTEVRKSIMGLNSKALNALAEAAVMAADLETVETLVSDYINQK